MFYQMSMIYECNVCACKLIGCFAEENKSEIAGDNKIFDRCWRFEIFVNLYGEKLYRWGDQEFGLYANLLGNYLRLGI